MKIAVDTHVHLYPFYDLDLFLEYAVAHLTGADARAICLTDRAGQSEFSALREGRRAARHWTVEALGEPGALRARDRQGRELIILAGRQIVTRERIEVLALCCEKPMPDGGALDDTLARVRDSGAVPVLPWGLGKWWGSRGRLVERAILSAAPGSLAVGDTCLRPSFFGESSLHRLARSRGLAMLFGSDPLPRAGEERFVGRLATLFEGEWDPLKPVDSFRRLVARRAPATEIGSRCSFAEFILRAR